MTDHLPECGQFCDGQPPKCRGGDCTLCDEVDCICAALRACEERAYSLGIEVGKHDGWLAGRADGLDAARKAVADHRVPWPTATGDLVNEGIDAALAAIDALVKGSENNE